MEEASVWLIAGPTASGKSAMALDLARRIGGEIVNADSMQVYRDLRVLTARPADADEAAAPHHLFGIADGADAWSVGRWLRAVAPVLAEIAGRERPAIVVGGTGLYLRALTHGLAEIPPVPATVRADIGAAFERDGEATFRTHLRAVDPEAEARIAPGDRQRLIRAQEVATATGRPLSEWRRDTRPTLTAGSWRGVVLEPPRAALHARIDARFGAMLAEGALSEVKLLVARGLPQTAPVMKALGVRELAAHLAGRLSLDEAREQARRETRRFAKRQSTWFRNQVPTWPHLADSDVAAIWLTGVKQSS